LIVVERCKAPSPQLPFQSPTAKKELFPTLSKIPTFHIVLESVSDAIIKSRVKFLK
jgi:hypothetical protein